MNRENDLETPFFGIINNLGFSHFQNFHYFATDTLFWSLSRLFLHYHRILYPIYKNQVINRSYIESDIESFIIRQRIILNDIAYIIRQILPVESRGLKGPKGGVHPSNKDMRISDIIDYVEKNKNKFSGLHKIFEKNKSWILEIRNQRDGIEHYKSKMVLFETKPDISFAIFDAARTEKTEPTEDGGERVIMTPVFKFINIQTKSLWDFLNIDIKNWIREYIKDENMKYKEIGKNSRMSCIGIPLFKEINKIE
jgi:hypothetical protein